jgi:hypothetical protein
MNPETVDSTGQYGHFYSAKLMHQKTQEKCHFITTYPLVLLNFCRLSFETTCPQLIIIGGFCSVDWSLDTGHSKTEWYRFSGSKGISICASVSKADLDSEATHRQLVGLAPFALSLPHYLPPILYFASAPRAKFGRKHVLQIKVDRVQGKILVWRLLHPLLGKEDQATHQTLEFCWMRGEEWL